MSESGERRNDMHHGHGSTEDMLGVWQPPPSYREATWPDGKVSDEADPRAAETDSSIDASGFALAVYHGLSANALNYVWYRMNERDFQVYYEIGRGEGSSLLMDLNASNDQSKFVWVLSHETRPVSSGEDPGLSAENGMAVIRALCRFVGRMVTGVEVNVKKYAGWADNWVTPGQVRVQSRRGSYKLVFYNGGYQYTVGYNKEIIRSQIGGNSKVQRDLDARERQNEELSRQASQLGKDKQRLDSQASKLRRQLEESRRKANGLANRIKSADGNVAKANANLRKSQEDVRQKERQISKLKEKLSQVRSDNNRLEHEMGRVCRENERYQDAQQDFEDRKMEYENFKRAQEELETENSLLRDKISVLKSPGRRLDSKFWTKKELTSEFDEIGGEFHLNAMYMLQDSTQMSHRDINTVLWKVLFAVKLECDSKFEQMEAVLCMKKNKALRNEFMAKIHDYFDELIDRDEIVGAVCGLFAEELGELVEDETLVKYVHRCTLMCWVLALQSKPRLEFYPTEQEADVENAILGKEMFESSFVAHSDCKVRRTKYVRFLHYVLPGLRRVGDGQIEMRPCVMVEAVRESEVEEKKSISEDVKADEALGAEAVDGGRGHAEPKEDRDERDDAPDEEVAERAGDVVELWVEQEPGAAEPMDMDSPNEEGSEGEEKYENAEEAAVSSFDSAKDRILKEEKARLEELLSNGDVDEAFGNLKQCGLRMESGSYVLALKCAECGGDAGQISNDPDADFGCHAIARHTDVVIDGVFKFF